MPVVALTIPAADDVPLAATLYEPEASAAGPVVLVNSATGVKRTFYDAFARHLAAEGLPVLTYDYRGIGGSRPERLRGFPARVRDWGELDLSGAIAWLVRQLPDRPIVAIGHSLGGQIVGLAPNTDRLSAMLTVGAQSGWWRHWPAPRRYLLACLWYVAMPASAALLGYFPAQRLALGEDLPGGVAREWARWCRSPQYMVDDAGAPLRPYFDRFSGPLLALSFTDDRLAPPPAVSALVELYSSAALRRQHLDPRSLGLSSLGHFGFFRERARTALWEPTVAWLREPAARPLVGGA